MPKPQCDLGWAIEVIVYLQIRNLAAYRSHRRRRLEQAATRPPPGGAGSQVELSLYYWAVLALLATKELGTSKRSATIYLFDREFMAPRELSRELSSWLHDAFAKRLEADYALRTHVTPEDASKTLAEARELLKAVREYLDRIDA